MYRDLAAGEWAGVTGGMQDEDLARMPGCLATSDIKIRGARVYGWSIRYLPPPLSRCSPVLLRLKQVENHYLDPATYLYTS